MTFYAKIVRKLVEHGQMSSGDSVLAVCAGKTDRNIFYSEGFKEVIISNLDHHAGVKDYDPYRWELQDAEALTYDDSSFDWVVVHAGLHHCASPHHALCEMLRVARKGVLVFEARDSLLVRCGVALGFTTDFETQCLAISDGKVGGYRDSIYPNYVYRWVEREVVKTVNSYLPQFEHVFSFHYGYRIPIRTLKMSPRILVRIVAYLSQFLVPIASRLAPRMGNEFAFTVSKGGRLRPWLKEVNGEITPNMEHLRKLYRAERY